jgi:hypothetical protein
MPLLGTAAMLLNFEVVDTAIAEHDEWHTHEHMPERLSIPGFLRGTRWVALRGLPRYCVIYEVESLQTLASDAYLERLNHPTAWTTRMMPQYRGMTRGLCTVAGSRGSGVGHFGLLVRFKPAPGADAALSEWLLADLLPQLPTQPGLGSAHLLQGALAPAMTNEQRIRGADAGVDWALLVIGYSEAALAALSTTQLSAEALTHRGASDFISTLYRSDYTLTNRDIDASIQKHAPSV